jgi:hypothetical protein
MTTPTGAIKFSDITTEFGTPTGNNLGAFRVNQTIIGQSWPLDTGVPTSGAISFSQLQGKTLNVVIDSGTTGDEYDVTLTSYFPSKATAVGGLYALPGALSSLGGKKYYVYLRKDYGGSASVTTSVKSGAWPSGSTLNVVVSNSATIWGRGGNGGGAGYGGGWGAGGETGSNSIGFSYSANLTVNSGSRIIAGFGGGGGGGGGYSNPDPGPYDPSFAGGGGGGGQGNPGGTGGYNGYPGSKTNGGTGGDPQCFPQINGKGGGGGGGGGITAGGSQGCQGGGWGIGESGSINVGGSGAGGNSGGGGGGGGGNGTAILQNGVTVTVSNGGYCYPSATPVTAAFT